MSEVFTIPDHQRAVADMDVDTRAAFITRTYTHLFGAILGFVALEIAMYQTGLMEQIAEVLMTTSFGWIAAFGGFMVVGWLASRTAHAATSPVSQYLALGGYVVAWAVMFAPLLYIANLSFDGVIQTAAIITLVGFTGLTAIVFVTKKDFSFLGGILRFGFILALIAIVGGLIFGFSLGLWFSVLMVGLAAGAILHDTSNVLRHYPEDRHVGAALQLFASVALLFWYVILILMRLQSD
jgi:FtsH-binding integral membrane protein